MSAWLIAAWLLGASAPETLAGTVTVTRSTAGPTVAIIAADAKTVTDLVGEPAVEVGKLAGTQVEVVGLRDGHRFVVQAYRILDLGRGLKPSAIGTLILAADGGLAITDGEGSPIPLSAAPRMRQKLDKQLGGKLWVAGEKLLSGAIKVGVFGVLREPPPKPQPADK